MAKLSLENVGKSFDSLPALTDVTTTIADGEFVALLGPSGCGKSTLLRLMAGFDLPSTGRICIGADVVADAETGQMVPPETRNIGFVFQSYALWPHMSVRRNVGYPLEVRGLSRADREAQVNAALQATALMPYAERMPADLSGGQRQRVALARCLVLDPTAVLLDEPLANLDVALRASMQNVFSDFHRRTGATMVYVTHDQSEAMAMADRIAVMDQGRILQIDTPEALYARPRSRFVADFIGQGAVVPLVDTAENAAMVLGAKVSLKTDTPAPTHACLRPENLTLGESGDLRVTVEQVTYLGGSYRLSLRTVCNHLLVAETRLRHAPGAQLGVSIHAPWAFAA